MFTYVGAEGAQFYTTYFFSNLDIQANTFAFGVTYDGGFASAAFAKLSSGLLIVASMIMFSILF